jgi:hypothetical protein
MTRIAKRFLTASAVVGMLTIGQAADALTIFASVGGAPTGVNLLNFDDLVLGSGSPQGTNGPSGAATVVFTPNGQAVQGSAAGLYAAPFLSGGNGTGFGPGGSNQANGADATIYLTSGSTGAFVNAAVELQFAAPQLYLGLLWGSVDNYNTLRFYNGATLVDTVTGVDVLASPNGDQGVNGTVYVNINTTGAFNRVVATSSQFAFEFDNVAYSASPVPDGGTTLMLLGLALGGLGLVRSRLS